MAFVLIVAFIVDWLREHWNLDEKLHKFQTLHFTPRENKERDRDSDAWPPVYAARTKLLSSEIAELTVVDALTDCVKNEPHHIMQNVTLRLSNGGSSQIDVILISQRGIFVVEVKNFRGIIEGEKDQPIWYQSRGFEKREFRNPIDQNYSHTRALNECFDIPLKLMHSLVVFSGESRFKVEMPHNVITLSELKGFVEAHEPEMLTEQQMMKIIGQVELMRLPQCRETDENHVSYVTNKAGATGS